jgi:propionyl-CoA carboxylase beta chain
MFSAAPELVKTVAKQDINKEDLGGAKMHSSISGVAHRTFLNDIEAIASTRKLLSYLP